MKSSVRRMLKALKQDAEPPRPPEPEPDFTGWTHEEINDWKIDRMTRMTHAEHVAAIRAAAESPSQKPPAPPEQFAAEDARDDAILAERKAQAAAARPAEHPGSAAAQINASAARKAADIARRAAEEAERLAEEAARRPPPVEDPDAPGPGAAPAKAKAEPTPPQERAPEPEPEPEPKPKEWWEERAHWRRRSSWDDADARRGRPMYETLHKYDPMEREEDYDPFE